MQYGPWHRCALWHCMHEAEASLVPDTPATCMRAVMPQPCTWMKVPHAHSNLLIPSHSLRRSLLEWAVGARLVWVRPTMSRAISFEYLNRQLVWQEVSYWASSSPACVPWLQLEVTGQR